MILLTLTPALLNKGYRVENMIEALPNHPTKRYPTRPMEGVDTFVYHHMASESPLINQAAYHINGRGWPRIGYHLVIWGNRIIQTNYLDTLSNHCSGYNPRSIGIAVLADFSKRPMTAVEKELSAVVLASLNEMFPNRQIKGHRECGVATSCPVVSMDMIRNEVATLELKLSLEETPNDQLAKAVAVNARIADLYKTATTAGRYKDEANRKFARVHDIMKAEGLI